jgi:hypothetical protein
MSSVHRSRTTEERVVARLRSDERCAVDVQQLCQRRLQLRVLRERPQELTNVSMICETKPRARLCGPTQVVKLEGGSAPDKLLVGAVLPGSSGIGDTTSE